MLPAPPTVLRIKWGPASLPAPTVAAAGTLAFQRLSSPRPSAVPCPSVPTRRGGTPPVRSAFRSFLQGRRFLLAQPSVLRRPQLLTTWAWQSLVPVPQSPRCRASCRCERVSLSRPSGDAPSGPALRPRLRTYSLGGGKGPSVGLACCPSLRFRRSVPPVLRPSALPLPLRVGTPFRHPEPVFPACNPPFPERASARWNWFQCILSSPVRLVNFRLSISALRRFFQASFPSRQDRCCASSLSRTSAKMRSYPQAAQWLVDNSASCGICFVLVL